jgi:16S rRNA (cytosine967-C5)-methyltransferase
MIAPARMAAFDALRAWESSAALDLPAALAAARGRVRDPRDQALLTELVAGTVRMRAALDYQVGLRLSRALDRLDPAVLTALRLGAYQVLFVSRLPAPAVVNDAVSLTRRAGKTSAAALVNAVLRALARERDALTWPDAPLVTALSVRYSHPEWLVARWLARSGEAATRAWLEFDNQPPRLCLAVNRARATREALAAGLAAEGVRTAPTRRAPHGLVVLDGNVFASRPFRDGWCVVQDEAAQLVAELGTMPRRATVLDLCAAPGGKTVALAGRAGAGARIVACDVRPKRVRLLAATMARCGLDRVYVLRVDPAGALPFQSGAFDFVLVDAPCSGLGTLRRDPDIRWRRREVDLARFAAAQRLLLARTADVVAPGGCLVYATCSSEPDENEDVVAAFVAEERAFWVVHEHRTSPAANGLEAFYAAVIARNV